jgi:hypothetical protein
LLCQAVGRVMAKSTKSRRPGKLAKPYADFASSHMRSVAGPRRSVISSLFISAPGTIRTAR